MTIQFPEKIGIGAFPGGDPMNPPVNDAVIFNGIKAIGFKTYYTWHPAKLMGDDGSLLFHPAFFYPSDVTTANLALAKATNQLIIGFNEPWHTDPGWINTSPTAALDMWPQFLALGNRLATPSISGPNDGNDWLAQFMAGAASRGYRVDVINVHYYNNGFASVQDFQTYLQGVYNLYGKPIVITEWALGSWADPGFSLAGRQAGQFSPPPFTLQQQVNWLNAAIPMLDALPFVEKHFWFAATEGGGWYLNSGVINADGSKTAVGDAFSALIASASVSLFVGGYVCDGDSLTYGAAQDGNPVTPYPAQLATLTGKPTINLGISGQTIATMNANYAANVAPRYDASTANVLILEGGANDIVNNATASQIDVSVRSYCAKARATGFRVYLMTMPPFPQGGVLGGPPSPTIATVNADRRANWAQYCDGLIDIAADTAFSDDTNRTYYQADQTHWTTAADTVVANLVKNVTMAQAPIVIPPNSGPPPVPSGPSMSAFMNAANLILNPDQGTAISPVTGSLPTYSSLLNARNIHRRT